MSKTRFNWIGDDWKRVKNHCRTTMRKVFSEKEPTEAFKKAMLICEHSPIRCLDFDWTWEDIPYWVSTEWSRHKHEKFISSQRNDRQDDYDRNAARQDAPVIHDGYANMQNLIDAWRKRLCYQATPEARSLAEDFKCELHKTHPNEADVLVPNCVYRCGCPEFTQCGFWKQFLQKKQTEGYDLFNIQERYEAYNKDFYEKVKNNESPKSPLADIKPKEIPTMKHTYEYHGEHKNKEKK